MILGLASGNVYTFFEPKDHNKILELLQPLYSKYHLQALELTYSDVNDFDLPLTTENIAFLRQLKHVSVHFPFKIIIHNNEQINTLLKKAGQLCQQINAQFLIIHPEQIPSLDLIQKFQEKYHLNIVTEIENPKIFPLSEFDRFLKKSQIKFVFDTGHAEFHPPAEIKKFLETHQHLICEVHLNKVKNKKAHAQFFNQQLSFTFNHINILNVPMIIEELFEKENFSQLESEINFLQTQLE